MKLYYEKVAVLEAELSKAREELADAALSLAGVPVDGRTRGSSEVVDEGSIRHDEHMARVEKLSASIKLLKEM